MSTSFPNLNSQRLWISTTGKTITNTASETSVISSTGIGSLTIPANFFTVGKVLRVRLGGTYQTPLIPSNVTVKVKLGSTVIDTTVVTGSVLATSSTANRFVGDALITCQAVGASGSVVIEGGVGFGVIISSIPVLATVDINNAGAATTVDTTISQVFDITATWAAAQIGQGTITTNMILEAIN